MGGIYRATISNWKNQDLHQQVFTSDIYQKWRKRKWKLLPATAGIYEWSILYILFHKIIHCLHQQVFSGGIHPGVPTIYI